MSDTTINGLPTQGISLSNTDFGSFAAVIPQSMKFQPSQRGMSALRTPVLIRAEQQQYSSNANKLIRFQLPNDALYDTRKGYLSFNLTQQKTGGTYMRNNQGIGSIFQRLRVIANSTEIEDQRDYGRHAAIQTEILNTNDVLSAIAVPTMGYGSQAQRNAAFPVADFVCPLFSGVLNTELLPFDNISAGVVLELYLDDAVNSMETDGTNPIITVSNPVLHIERLDVDESYRASLKSYVGSFGLRIGYRTWVRFQNALNTGTRADITIQTKNSSMNGMLNVFTNSSEISNPAINDRFINWTPTPGGLGTLQQSQLQINGKMFPDEPIDCVTFNRYVPYQMYARWVMRWNTNGILALPPPITSQTFAVNRFIQIDDLEAYPEEPDLVNPRSTLNMNNTIIKKIQFSGLIAAGWQLDTWVESFQEAMISQNGRVALIQ